MVIIQEYVTLHKVQQWFVLLVAVILCSDVTAQALSVQDIDVKAGGAEELIIQYSGDSTITALQFNLKLPKGITTETGSITLGTATDGHTLRVEPLETGDLLFVLYSLDFKAFKNGELLRIPLKADKNEFTNDGKLYTFRTATKDAVSHECNNTTFTVTVKNEIFIKAKSYSRIYGEANPEFEYTVDGGTFEGTPEIKCAANKTSPVGEYPIVIKNGSITNHFVTYVNGTLIVEKAPLTAKAGDYTMKQGEALPEITASYAGWKNSETETVLEKKPTLTTTATSESEPGTYDVLISGAEAQNYDISYIKGTLTITEADPVTITANNYTREYGEANPVFEYTSEGAALDGVPEIVCEATETSPVGTYDIVVKQGTVKNYNVTYVGGTLTVTKAPLTVSVGNYTREYGQDNPEFMLTYGGCKNGEDESVLIKKPVATTYATIDSPVGEYAIRISGGEAQNYSFNYVDGILTITEPSRIDEILNDGQPFDVYNLAGKKVLHQVMSISGIPRGVYIVRGHVIFVK